jgi:release factor glutamine methyltransferase
MTLNQAFEILKNAGGTTAARIITNKWKKPSHIRVLWTAWQLRRGVPVAKIIHEKWFYGMQFYTNKWTLDPRPDSETIVEAVLKEQNSKKINILDLGTGTGCLVAAIINNLPGATGVGIDKSVHACHVARKNIRDLGLKNRIKILNTSFNFPQTLNLKPQTFDIIISNPPYIAHGDVRVDIGARHDPRVALYAKNNGLAAYESIAKNAKKWLKPNGKIYLEIGVDQGPGIREIFLNNGWCFESSFDDLSGIERVLSFML